MHNDLLWLIYVLVDLSVVVAVARIFGKRGLLAIVVLSSILANIQVVELVPLFGFTVAIGNVTYASIYFATDLLSEFYSKQEARKAVLLGLTAIVLMAFYMQLMLQFVPSPFDKMHPHLAAIFNFVPRISLGSVLAYAISQNIDVTLFHFWKGMTGEKHLWLRNNGSTMISQAVDSIVFVTVAFYGVFPMAVFWSILISNYIFKWLIALIDTGFIYFVKFTFGDELKQEVG